jgi:hypothetical protein
VKSSKRVRRVRVSADGAGVVSHAGVGLLRETAEHTGLVDAVSEALLDTYRGVPIHAPGRVFADLAVAVADGADAISGIAALVDRQDLHGPVASMPTTWRVLDRIDAGHLDVVRAARAVARAAAWAAGAGPDLSEELRLDFDATITIAHSEKDHAAPTWKRTFGFHPLLCFLDRPDVAGGEALAGLLRPGNAGSNTAADHLVVLDQALAALPEQARPRPGDPTGPRLLARSDSAGATHAFAAGCVARGVEFSFGFPVDWRIQTVVDVIPEACWHPAIQTDDDLREGAWVAEATGLVDLSGWPEGSRLILRKEHPHPGAQLTFADVDGMRITAFLTNTPPAGSPARPPDWSCGIVNTPGSKTGSAKPKPAGCVTCPAAAGTRTRPGSKSCSPPSIWSPGPRRSASPTPPNSPAARSPPSATGSCTSPPGSPARLDRPDSASTTPGAGRAGSPPPSTASGPRSPDTRHPHPDNQDLTETAHPTRQPGTDPYATSKSA